MELWIRSQDKEELLLTEHFDIYRNNQKQQWEIAANGVIVAKYKKKKRALEVLDEIQSKIKTILYLRCKSLLKLEDIEFAKKYFEKLNGMDFITCDHNFEIEPITTNTMIYEMPEK